MFFFFFNDTATTEIYTLSLHDALPILEAAGGIPHVAHRRAPVGVAREAEGGGETGARAQPRGEPGRRADGGGHRALRFDAHVPAQQGAALLAHEAAPGGRVSVVAEGPPRGRVDAQLGSGERQEGESAAG